MSQTLFMSGMTVYYIESNDKPPKMATIKTISPAPHCPDVKYAQLNDGSVNGCCKMLNQIYTTYGACETEIIKHRDTNGFKIGETAWVKIAWSDKIINTIIKNFHIDSSTGELYAEMDDVGYICNINKRIHEMYHSEKECRDAMNIKNEAIRNSYRANIQTIKDLVKFMWTHSLRSEEYTDWNARIVVQEKAKEFGIELETE